MKQNRGVLGVGPPPFSNPGTASDVVHDIRIVNICFLLVNSYNFDNYNEVWVLKIRIHSISQNSANILGMKLNYRFILTELTF